MLTHSVGDLNLFFYALSQCGYYHSWYSLHNYARGICHHGGEHISEPKLPEYGLPGGIWETTQEPQIVHVL